MGGAECTTCPSRRSSCCRDTERIAARGAENPYVTSPLPGLSPRIPRPPLDRTGRRTPASPLLRHDTRFTWRAWSCIVDNAPSTSLRTWPSLSAHGKIVSRYKLQCKHRPGPRVGSLVVGVAARAPGSRRRIYRLTRVALDVV